MAVVPAALRDGDLIGVCAPAGRPPAARLQRGLDRLRERFALRLGPVVEAALRGDPPFDPMFLAADDQVRADELNALLADRDVRAIIMARGGYGLMRILPLLDPAPLVADPRPIIGFSDVPALLSWALRHGVRGVHGPVVTQLGELPPDDVAWLYRLLTDRSPPGRVPWPVTPFGDLPPRPVRAPVIGGNLTMLSHLVGTPWPVPLEGAALLIEEVEEEPYALDRDLTQLGLAHQLAGVACALVGDLTRCLPRNNAAGDPEAARRVVIERLMHHGVCGVAGLPIGHGDRNMALPFGGACEIDLGAATIDLVEAAVA